jgi:dihydroxyacetone kinase-like predicted kinase
MKTFYSRFVYTWAAGVMLASLLAVSACQTLPRTFNEKLASAYLTHTAVMTAATNALNAREITSDDAQRVLTLANDSRVFLDAAKVAHAAGDLSTAEGRLALGVSVLSQVQAFLRSKGAP